MSSRSLEYATSEEVFHLCTKNLQKGVGKYHLHKEQQQIAEAVERAEKGDDS